MKFSWILYFCSVAVCFAADKAPVRGAVSDPLTDVCLPQIVAGGGWKTTITLMNMLPTESRYGLAFLDSKGEDFTQPINTPNGRVSASELVGTLPRNGSVTYEIVDTGRLQQSWAILVHNGIAGFNGRVTGHAIFQQQVAGRPPFEAVVPLSNLIERRNRLPFDNTNGYQPA